MCQGEAISAAECYRGRMGRSWVIVGCGYTGTRLARRLLSEGEEVVATRRDPDAVAQLGADLPGATVQAFDLAAPQLELSWLPAGARVVHSAPPTGDPEHERRFVAALAGAGAERLIYLSSTGVYAPGRGDWVDEEHPTLPLGDQGARRLAAEEALLAAAADAGLAAASLRIAGIYGPGRGVHARVARGDYRVLGAGSAFVSRVHVDDLVAAIVCAATAEPLPGRIYNVADLEPTTSRVHADGVAALLGLPAPPSVPPEEVSLRVRAMLGADRKIASGKLQRELGWTPRYPSWREGARQAIREDGLGQGE